MLIFSLTCCKLSPGPWWRTHRFSGGMARDRAVWHCLSVPLRPFSPYATGPNHYNADLLDVLAREGVPATFFLIDGHVTDETAPIVQRMFAEGHAVGLHSATRAYMLLSPDELAGRLTAEADRIEVLAGTPPCRAFRPHAGWRGGQMYDGLETIDYTLVGWGWMLWDWNWFRARTADSTLARLAARVSQWTSSLHDGDDQRREVPRQTVEATAALFPSSRPGFALEGLPERSLTHQCRSCFVITVILRTDSTEQAIPAPASATSYSSVSHARVHWVHTTPRSARYPTDARVRKTSQRRWGERTRMGECR